MDARTAHYYEAHAAEVAAKYESAPSPLERYYPLAFPAGARVLDVGAGSGRDLAALLRRGHDAYGVEPSAALRQAAVAAHPALRERLIHGALPDIGSPFGGQFDGLVCCAVLMHVPDAQIFDAALGLRNLLKPHGRLLLSVPAARTDVGADRRDSHGRLFEPYQAQELELLFDRLGMPSIGRWESEDVQQRTGIRWVTLLLERRVAGQIRAVDQIEGILNRDRKVATYKFALLRAEGGNIPGRTHARSQEDRRGQDSSEHASGSADLSGSGRRTRRAQTPGLRSARGLLHLPQRPVEQRVRSG